MSPWATPVASQSALKANRTDPDLAYCETSPTTANGEEAWNTLDKFAELGLTLDDEEDEQPVHILESPSFFLEDGGYDIHGKEAPRVVKPFHKWMKTLQRRARQPKHRDSERFQEPFPEFSFPEDAMSCSGHRKSSSESSMGYVAGVRSASISLAGSVMARSRRNTARSSHHAKTDHSSRASISIGRRSEDSVRLERNVVDPAVTERLLQRRRILEELISTEESYIGDIKFLMNVYVTILACLPSQHPGLRSSINRNLTDIVELHEEILGELHRAVPNSEYTQVEQLSSVHKVPCKPSHHRWRSLDSVPEDEGGISWLQNVPGMTAEPDVAAEVALIFGRRMHRFFVYEEYGAKYEMMIKDVASAHRTMPQWDTYQKGLEALAFSLGPMNSRSDQSRKSLTIGDLLVKPIQRICKYPLLFAELLKYTPVYDCPNSHAEIENVLVRIREATSEINRATDDPSVKATMEKTWLLQDRLAFPDQCLYAALKTTIRSLGQIQLCGALHVCWQTREGVDGQYMVCLLYKDCLCLATASRVDQLYIIRACIGMNTIKIEDADNGRGLQCHTAPFSWKLVFEVDHQLYEMIMTACTSKEEVEWRTRLADSIPGEVLDHAERPLCSTLSLNIKSLGTVFGKPGTVARRLSIHRATTVGPKSPLYQVILKNTTTMRDPPSATSGSPFNRSLSLLTTNSRIPILAPSRGDRARLEALLADVWSRKVLPFPGITTRSRSEHLVRNSASTMMRKLSVANITNSFAKRSASGASMSTTKIPGDEQLSHVDHFAESLVTHDEDSSSSSLRPEQEHGDIQRLPMIRDETEGSPSLPPTITTTLSGKVGKLDLSNFDSQKLDDFQCKPNETRFEAPDLQTCSTDRAPQLQSSSQTVRTAPSHLSGKESQFQWSQAKHPIQDITSHAKPHVSKWPKVGAINRGLMAEGIRSFFR